MHGKKVSLAINVNMLLRQRGVDSALGAPMARTGYCHKNDAIVVLQQVVMQDDCYDVGGAYWGGPCPAGVMWCAADIDNQVWWFCRAPTWEQARDKLFEDHPGLQVVESDVLDLESFIDAFIEAMIWADKPEGPCEDDDDGELYDADEDPDLWRPDNISESLMKLIRADCEKFLRENQQDIMTFKGQVTAEEQAGHDFYLTRQHHGCGFWDGDWEDAVGERLTEAAHEFTELCVGPDADNKLAN